MGTIGTKLIVGTGLTYLALDDAANNQVAVAQPEFEMPAPGYITRIGTWGRKIESSAAYFWLGVYSLNESGAPDILLARTDRLSLGQAGSDVSGAVTWVNPALNPTSQAAVRMRAGQRFAIAVKSEDGPFSDNEIAYYGGVNTTHYLRTYNANNTPPSNPFGASGTAVRPTLAMYVEWTENTAPTATLTSPADGGALSTTTPTITGVFSDPQSAAPVVDRMSAYEIEIANNATGVVIWGGPGAVFVASAAERAASIFTRVYSGPALTTGITYRLRAKVIDDSGAESGWTAPRTFTISARGQVDTATDGVPTGKQDGDSALLDWSGRWHHPSGHQMNAAQVFIYRDGALFRSGVAVNKVVNSAALPGTAFTVQDTEAGIGSLPAGAYTYHIAGRSATDGLWSELSPGRSFSVNAKPTTPANLQPPSGAVSTSYPLLEWNISDPDADDVYGVDADSVVEITQPNGTVTTYVTANYDAGRGIGYLQLSATHVPVYGTYKWRVWGRDTSAAALGIGLPSAMSSFTYALGPVVTVTNPTEGEAENTTVPVFAWTNTGGAQVRARILLYREDLVIPFKAIEVPGSTQSVAAAPGLLVKGQNYDMTATVVIAGEVSGTSLRRRFSVSYTDPVAPSNVQVTPYAERRDYYFAPSSVMVSFDQSVYGPGEFAGYNIYRRLAAESADQAVLLRTLPNPGQNRWRDAWVPSKTLLMYGVSQMRNVGGVITESPITWVAAEIALVVPVLVSAYDPDIRFPCMYMEREYGGKDERPKAYYTTWGSKSKRTKATVPHDSSARTVRLTVTCRSDERGHLYDHVADLEQLVNSGHPLLFRSENPNERFYCDLEWDWQRGGIGERNMKMVLTEIDFTPGTAGGS